MSRNGSGGRQDSGERGGKDKGEEGKKDEVREGGGTGKLTVEETGK